MTARAEVHTGEPASTSVQKHEPRPQSLQQATPETTLDVVRFAIERGLSAAELKELVHLQIIVEERQARRDFANAMSAFKAEIRPIAHSKTANIATRGGGKFSYSYAELDAIAREIDPVLAKHGLSYRWSDSRVDDKGMLTATCVVSHVNGHSESSSFTLPTANDSAASPQQKIGGADTYAKRRSLISALGLTTTEDDTDGAMDVDTSVLNGQQITAIEDLIEESGSDRARFLKYMGAASVSEIRAADFNKAVAALEAKRAKQ
jgi:hypothetical protein